MPLPAKHTHRRIEETGPERDLREQERKRKIDEARANDPYRKFYSTPEWFRTKARHRRDHPRCADCGHDPKKDQSFPVKQRRKMHVDHLSTEWRRTSNLKEAFKAFLHGPFKTRCHNCHSAKTARQDGGFGNPRGQVIRKEVY